MRCASVPKLGELETSSAVAIPLGGIPIWSKYKLSLLSSSLFIALPTTLVHLFCVRCNVSHFGIYPTFFTLTVITSSCYYIAESSFHCSLLHLNISVHCLIISHHYDISRYFSPYHACSSTTITNTHTTHSCTISLSNPWKHLYNTLRHLYVD